MLTDIIAYKVYRIFEEAEIQNTSESNWVYAERVVAYFNNKEEYRVANQDYEELFLDLYKECNNEL